MIKPGEEILITLRRSAEYFHARGVNNRTGMIVLDAMIPASAFLMELTISETVLRCEFSTEISEADKRQ